MPADQYDHDFNGGLPSWDGSTLLMNATNKKATLITRASIFSMMQGGRMKINGDQLKIFFLS